MLAIVGLGNWQEKYWPTRHNFGALVVENFSQNYPDYNWQKNKRLDCLLFKTPDFILVKPQLAMNNNGLAVKKLVNFYKLAVSNLLIIHDDLDLDLGQLKLNTDQGSAGHHGVESVISALANNNFWRLRLGIGHPQGSSEDEVINFVLKKFSDQEKAPRDRAINEALKLLKKGIDLSGWESLRGSYKI